MTTWAAVAAGLGLMGVSVAVGVLAVGMTLRVVILERRVDALEGVVRALVRRAGVEA